MRLFLLYRWNQRGKQLRKPGFDSASCFHHLFVTERLRLNTGREVCDAGDAEHLDAHMPRGDHFLNGGHADQIGTKRAKGPYLGWSFEAGSEHAEINAFRERKTCLFG